MKLASIILVCITWLSMCANAQIILTENFEGAVFPPAGWKTERVLPSPSTTADIWKKQAQAGFFTVFSAYGGTGMATFNSYNIISGRAGDLATPPLDFSDGKNHKVRFRTFRQFPFRSGQDKITVYANSTQTSLNATEIGLVYRSRLSAPSELLTGWIEYEVNIPDSFNTDTTYIIFRGTGGNGDDMGLDNVVIESFDCNNAVDVIVSNVTENSASINWQAPPLNAPLAYHWQVRFAGTPGSGASGLQQAGTSSGNLFNITGLKPGLDYFLYLKTQCNTGTNGWMPAAQFKTLFAATLPLPYFENFDSIMYPSLPSCYKVEDKMAEESYKKEWAIRTNAFNASSSGENSFGCIVGVTNNNQYDNWFFLPAFAFQSSKLYELSFQQLAILQNGVFEIKLGKFASADSMANSPVIFSYNNPNQPALAPRNILFEVDATGNYYLGFHIVNSSIPATSNFYQTFLDDIRVKENAASCFRPTNITVTNISASGATLNWNVPGAGTPSNYKWELRTSGMPATGATGLVASGTVTAGTFSATATSLQSGTRYYFYVQSLCSVTDTSIWSLQKAFITTCATLNLPYVQYFDNIASPQLPACGKVTDVNNDGRTWKTKGFSPPGGSNPNALYYEDYTSSNADDWWFTEGINMPPGNSYRFYFRYAAMYLADSLEVRYGSQPDPSHMQRAALVKLKHLTNSSYFVADVNFTPQTEGPLYFGFHYVSTQQASSLYIDNIIITSNGAVACSPPLDLAATSVEADSIVVKWKKPATYASVTSYKWEARTNELPGVAGPALIASGTFTTTDTTAIIRNIPPNSSFNFYLSSVCNATASAWAGPVPMNTPCANLVLPYTQNFDQVTAPAIPTCFVLQDGNVDAALWKTLSNSQQAGAAQSSPNAMYFYNTNFITTPSDDWFFIPPFTGVSDKVYRLSFSYKSANNVFPEALQVRHGTQPLASAMMGAAIFNNNSITNINYTTVSADFSPNANGKTYIGFRAFTSSPGAAGLYIDNIQLVELPGSSLNTWLGITADWNTATNWSTGTVPSATTDATINPGVAVMPVVTGTNNITRSLKINPGASIQVAPGAVLNILTR